VAFAIAWPWCSRQRTARWWPATVPTPRSGNGSHVTYPAQRSAVTGLLTDPLPATPLRWMYLIDAAHPGTLLTFANTGRWTLTGRTAMTVGRDVTVTPD